MAKSNNIVHQYFKKEFEGYKVLVKVNPIEFKGTELMIPVSGEAEQRNLDFDSDIFEDLKADGFGGYTSLEFNLYATGLAR